MDNPSCALKETQSIHKGVIGSPRLRRAIELQLGEAQGGGNLMVARAEKEVTVVDLPGTSLHPSAVRIDRSRG